MLWLSNSEKQHVSVVSLVNGWSQCVKRQWVACKYRTYTFVNHTSSFIFLPVLPPILQSNLSLASTPHNHHLSTLGVNFRRATLASSFSPEPSDWYSRLKTHHIWCQRHIFTCFESPHWRKSFKFMNLYQTKAPLESKVQAFSSRPLEFENAL